MRFKRSFLSIPYVIFLLIFVMAPLAVVLVFEAAGTFKRQAARKA